MKDKLFVVIVGVLVIILFGIVFLSPPSARKRPLAKIAPKTSMKADTAQTPDIASEAQLEDEIKQAKAMVSALVEMNTALKKNNSSLEDNIQRLEKVLAQSKGENINLTGELQDTTAQKEELLKEMSSLKVVVDELSQSTEPLKEKLKDIAQGLGNLKDSSAAKDFKKQLRTLNERLSGVAADIARLVKENNAYKISAQNLQSLLSDKNSELEALQKGIAQEGSGKDKLRDEKALISKELEQVRKTRSVFEDTVSELNKKNKSLTEEVSRLNVLLKERQGAARQAQEALTARDEATKIRKDLEAGIAALNTKNKELEQALQASRMQMETVNKQYADLRTEFGAYKENTAIREDDLAKRADEILRLRDKLIVNEAKTAELNTALKIQEKDTAFLRERFVSLQLENETLRGELSLTRSKLSDLRMELAQIVEMNSSLQGRLQGIGSIFKEANPATAQAPQQPVSQAQEQIKSQEAENPEGKKVDVELVPQQ